jgi:hypothetical protein
MTMTRGLALALVMVALTAGRASSQGIFTNQSVRDELKVTPEQAAKLDALDKELRAASREKALKARDLPYEERVKKMQGEFRQTWDNIHKRLAEFLSPEQVKRFDQISVQNAGFAAFTMFPHVRDRLGFTEDQVAKLLEVQEELTRMAGPRSALQQRVMEDPEGMRKKSEEATKAAIAKVIAVMTDEQKKTWADLTGPPFRMKVERAPIP